MCGIAGFISKDYGKEDLVKMTNPLKSRVLGAFGYIYILNKDLAWAM